MRQSHACLAVGHDGAVVAVENVCDHGRDGGRVHVRLGRLRPQDLVEVELRGGNDRLPARMRKVRFSQTSS